MSLPAELAQSVSRISSAKAAISTAISGKGVTVPSTTKLDGLAPLINQITTEAELQSISITTAPTKTSYIAGDAFDPTGMVVKAVISGVEVNVNGWTYSPTTMAAGTTSITVSYTLDGVTKTATQAVTVISFKSFAAATWAEIAQYAADGVAQEAFSVGDTRTETIDGTSYELVIYDFDHYDLADSDGKYNDTTYNGNSKKAAIVIGLKNLYSHVMCFDTDTEASWITSELRSAIQSNSSPSITGLAFFYYLPSALQNVIRHVKISYVSNGTLQHAADSIFIPSSYEIFGAQTTCAGPRQEGEQFSYYTAGNSKAKSTPLDGNNKYYWTRSMYYYTNSYQAYYEYTYALVVNSNGTDTNWNIQDSNNYISPVFCI